MGMMHILIHAHTYMYTCTYMHVHIICTHVQSYVHACTHVQSYIHACTHTGFHILVWEENLCASTKHRDWGHPSSLPSSPSTGIGATPPPSPPPQAQGLGPPLSSLDPQILFEDLAALYSSSSPLYETTCTHMEFVT